MSSGIEALAAKIGADAISCRDADLLAVSADLWPRHLLRLAQGQTPALPRAVIWPRSEKDIQWILHCARAEGTSVVPYGAGSSVVGGASPSAQQWVLDTKRMNRLLGIDQDERWATAEVGMLGELYERELARQGFSQGHFPSSIYCSTLGGWVAARSAGQMSSRYGKIEDQLVGGTVVLADGTILEQAPGPEPALRSPIAELVGAEGTACIWTKVTCRVHPQPERRAFWAYEFQSLSAAVEAVRRWLWRGVSPAVIRIYDPLDTLIHRRSHSANKARRDHGPSWLSWLGAHFPKAVATIGDRLASTCRVVLVFEGDAQAVALDVAEVAHIAMDQGARSLGAEPALAWYRRRYAYSYNQSNAFRAGVVADTMEVGASWDQLVPTYHAVRAAALGAGAAAMAHFSHFYLEGGSFYFTFGLPVSAGVSGYDRLWAACVDAAVTAGGNVSHHHGVGHMKRISAPDQLAWATLRRTAGDDGVLNPQVPQATTLRAAPMTTVASAPGLFRVLPTDTLAAIERQLGPDGFTLGLVAELHPHETVENAARAGRLVARNRQLGVVSSLVHDVEDAKGERPAVLAPRSAMGPSSLAQRIKEPLRALWLKPQRTRGEVLWLTGTPARVRQAARLFAQAPSLWTADVVAFTQGRLGFVRLRLGGGMRPSDLHEELIVRSQLRESPPPASLLAWGRARVGGSGTTWFSCGWRSFLGKAPSAFTIVAADAQGVVGVARGRVPAGPVVRRKMFSSDLGVFATLREPLLEGRGKEVMGHQLKGRDFSPGAPRTRAQQENCAYCPKLCRFACPVAVASGNEAYTPRQLVTTVHLARTRVRPFTKDSAARLFGCVDCGGCESFCDHGNRVPEVLAQARAEVLPQAPDGVRAVLRHLLATGDMPGMARAKTPRRQGGRRALFLCCSNTAEDAGRIDGLSRLARATHGDVGIADGPLRCCGHPLWRWGAHQELAGYARSFARQLRGYESVIVDEPGCAWMLGHKYAELGVRVPRIVSARQLLAGAALNAGAAGARVPHDCCFALRSLAERPLRELVTANWQGGSILEGQAGCCGGMLLPHYDPTLAQEVAEARVRDLSGGSNHPIVVDSAVCAQRLRAAGATVEDVYASVMV